MQHLNARTLGRVEESDYKLLLPYKYGDGGLGLHPKRWIDTFADQVGREKMVLTPTQIIQKDERNRAYSEWLVRHGLPNMRHRFQVVQVLSSNHANKSYFRYQWWDNYRDCLLTVWVTPVTLKCEYTKDWVQFYVVCPEDCELIKRYELKRQGITRPPRCALAGERWTSRDKAINKALLVPVECCRHFRHETTRGVAPHNI